MRELERNPGARRGSRLLVLALLLTGFVASIAPPPAAAATEEEARLRSAILERFEVLPLREGLALRPREAADYRVIEVVADEVSIDGRTVSRRTLRDRLGVAASDVEALRDLDEGARADLFGVEGAVEPRGTGVTVVVPDPPRPPAPPRAPRAPGVTRRGGAEPQVSVGSSATVESGEVVEDVVVVAGSVTVEEGAEVLGDAVAVGGGAQIDGRVTGDVVAVGGSVALGEHADVAGEVTSVGGSVEQAPGARVRGRINEVSLGPVLSLGFLKGSRWRDAVEEVEDWRDSFAGRLASLYGKFTKVAAYAIFACLAWLVARRPIERIARKIEEDAWRAGLVGLLGTILLLPMLVLVVVVLAISIIGIPLIVLVPFALVALWLAAFLGYVGVCERVGRFFERRFGWSLGSPFVVVLVGLLGIQGLGLLGRVADLGGGPLRFFAWLLLVAGGLVHFGAWLLGLGGAMLTRLGSQDDWSGWRGRRGPMAPVAPPPVPPAADMPDAMEAEGRAGASS